jgi:hypothetical protein
MIRLEAHVLLFVLLLSRASNSITIQTIVQRWTQKTTCLCSLLYICTHAISSALHDTFKNATRKQFQRFDKEIETRAWGSLTFTRNVLRTTQMRHATQTHRCNNAPFLQQ